MKESEPVRPLPLRLAVLAYGWVAYAFFVKAMVYFVGFSGDIIFKRTVDSGPAGPWPTAVFVDVGLLLAFFVPHSVMARRRFKGAMFSRFPAPVERSTYVLVASATIAIIIAAWRPIPYPIWDFEGSAFGTVLRTISMAGWALSLAGSFSQGHRALFGLKPAWDYFRGRPQEPVRLRTSWLYARLRHPMDLGFLIGLLCAPRMSAGHLLLTALFAAYVAIGVRYEERDLELAHGPAYVAYRKDVPWIGFTARKR
jgi:protein-S-isoprenylcysteine O-methyltransferase Ste14